MKYTVNQFIFYRLNEKQSVIQSDESITILKDPEMSKFIKSIESKNFLAEDDIYSFFGDRSKKAINYLTRNKIIQEMAPLNFNIKKLYLVTNDLYILNSTPDNLLVQNIKCEKLSFDTFLKQKASEGLYIFILNKYNKKLVTNIYNKINKNSNSFTLISFFYGFNYYIDNIYNVEWKNPNHFDHLGYIQSQILNDPANAAYQNIVDVIFDYDSNFYLETPLNDNIMIKILYLLISKIEKLLSLEHIEYTLTTRDLLEVEMYDYKLNKVYKDTAMFWELNQYE